MLCIIYQLGESEFERMASAALVERHAGPHAFQQVLSWQLASGAFTAGGQRSQCQRHRSLRPQYLTQCSFRTQLSVVKHRCVSLGMLWFAGVLGWSAPRLDFWRRV